MKLAAAALASTSEEYLEETRARLSNLMAQLIAAGPEALANPSTAKEIFMSLEPAIEELCAHVRGEFVQDAHLDMPTDIATTAEEAATTLPASSSYTAPAKLPPVANSGPLRASLPVEQVQEQTDIATEPPLMEAAARVGAGSGTIETPHLPSGFILCGARLGPPIPSLADTASERLRAIVDAYNERNFDALCTMLTSHADVSHLYSLGGSIIGIGSAAASASRENGITWEGSRIGFNKGGDGSDNVGGVRKAESTSNQGNQGRDDDDEGARTELHDDISIVDDGDRTDDANRYEGQQRMNLAAENTDERSSAAPTLPEKVDERAVATTAQAAAEAESLNAAAPSKQSHQKKKTAKKRTTVTSTPMHLSSPLPSRAPSPPAPPNAKRTYMPLPARPASAPTFLPGYETDEICRPLPPSSSARRIVPRAKVGAADPSLASAPRSTPVLATSTSVAETVPVKAETDPETSTKMIFAEELPTQAATTLGTAGSLAVGALAAATAGARAARESDEGGGAGGSCEAPGLWDFDELDDDTATAPMGPAGQPLERPTWKPMRPVVTRRYGRR